MLAGSQIEGPGGRQLVLLHLEWSTPNSQVVPVQDSFSSFEHSVQGTYVFTAGFRKFTVFLVAFS